MSKTKIDQGNVPGIGMVIATIEETVKADGTVFMRVLKSARYLSNSKPIENQHREVVAEYFRAV